MSTLSSSPLLPAVKSLPPARRVLVIEPVQQHLGLHAVSLPPGNQCSIGSARSCTLQVRASGIQAQHCLIVSGPNNTVLREWSDATWLNDRPVRQPVELIENDRLAVGPFEFRMRPARPEEVEAALQVPPLVIDPTTAGSLPDEMLQHREILARTQAQLAQEAAKLKEREHGLLARERELTERFEELEEKIRTIDQDQQEDSPGRDAARELDARVMELL